MSLFDRTIALVDRERCGANPEMNGLDTLLFLDTIIVDIVVVGAITWRRRVSDAWFRIWNGLADGFSRPSRQEFPE
jgi:hypothetical protein